MRSSYDADAFVPVLKRMAQYANNTTQARVQSRVAERDVNDESRAQARRLSGDGQSLSTATRWNYELQTLPRPKGRATHVVITEYDMPRTTIAPHDVRTDRDGYVWYSDFVENYLGRARSQDRRAQGISRSRCPSPAFPTGALELEPDADGNLWLAMMFQAGLAQFDMKTKTFRIFPLPARAQRRRHAAIDGDAARIERGRQGVDQ